MMNHDHLPSPTSIQDIDLASRKFSEYVHQAILPLIGMLIFQLLLFWLHADPTFQRIAQIAFFAALPFLLFRPSDWTLHQLLILSLGMGAVVGFEAGLLRMLANPTFSRFFEFLIQPVLGMTVALFSSSFIFLGVFPILKRLRKRLHSLQKKHGKKY